MYIFLLLACSPVPDDSGRNATGVGNPGDGVARMATAGPGLTITSASTTAHAITIEPCDGSPLEEHFLDRSLDLLTPEAIWLGEEPICGLWLTLDAPIALTASREDGSSFSLSLTVEDIVISVDAPVTLGGAAVLELGSPGWLMLSELDAVSTVDVIHDLLADRIAHGSALFADDDGDTEIDDAERSAEPAASGIGHPQNPAPGRYAAVGTGGRRMISEDDGETWIYEESDSDNPPNDSDQLRSVVGGRGRLVAVGIDGIGWLSFDGQTWEPLAIIDGDLFGVVFGDERFVAVGDNGRRAWSYDGVKWYDVSGGGSDNYRGITWGEAGFVAVGYDGIRSVSVDGVDWSEPMEGGNTLRAVAWGAAHYVAVGDSGRRVVSEDGLTWTNDTSGDADDLTSIMWTGSAFVAASTTALWRSSNGSVWSSTAVTGLTRLAAGADSFVAIGTSDERYTSPDGLNWTLTASGDGADLAGIGWLE